MMRHKYCCQLDMCARNELRARCSLEQGAIMVRRGEEKKQMWVAGKVSALDS